MGDVDPKDMSDQELENAMLDATAEMLDSAKPHHGQVALDPAKKERAQLIAREVLRRWPA